MDQQLGALQVMIMNGSLQMSCCSKHYGHSSRMVVYGTLAAPRGSTSDVYASLVLLHWSLAACWGYTYEVVLAAAAVTAADGIGRSVWDVYHAEIKSDSPLLLGSIYNLIQPGVAVVSRQ
jgi:hypothetical protein